ncbi:O-Antigen ligase [Pseudomonas cannabina]|nr:O-Antigen ligase [Pseudomonas cannabina]
MTTTVSRYLFCLLVAGFTIHVSGMLFITDGSRGTTISNLTLFLPALILLLIGREWRDPLLSRQYIPLLALLVFTVLVALLNKGSIIKGSEQFKTALYIMLYLGAIHWMVSRDVMEKVLNLLFVIASVAAFASIAYHLIMVDSHYLLSGDRLFKLGYENYADFQNPIVAALFYGVFGVYGVHQLLIRRYSCAVTLVFCLSVLSLSLYMYCTLSRGVWLGYGAAIGASVLLHNDSRSRKWLAVSAGVLLLAVILLSPVLLEQKVRGLSLRDVIWSEWLVRLGDFWLIGAGAGKSFDICIANAQCFKQAHNLYLQFFYEYGIVGAILLLGMIGAVFVRSLNRGLRASPLGTVGFPLFLFALLTALFDYHTVMNRPGVYWLVFWLPIGLILSNGSRAHVKSQQATSA